MFANYNLAYSFPLCLLLYQLPDGQTQLQVQLENDPPALPSSYAPFARRRRRRAPTRSLNDFTAREVFEQRVEGEPEANRAELLRTFDELLERM